MKSKTLLWLLAIGLIVGGLAINYGDRLPDWAQVEWPWADTSPVDRVVVLYESKNQPLSEVAVMGGTTSQAIRKAGKWREYDQNKLPEASKAALSQLIEKYGVPCIALVRKDAVVASAKLPASDEELASYVKKHGGF